MAAAWLNGVLFTPTLGGTTDWVVSAAVQGYMTPALSGAVTGTVYKYRAESADLSQWEIGEGTYTVGTVTLARTTVLYNSSGTGTATGQSGAGTKINFSTVPSVGLVAIKQDLISAVEDNSFSAAQQLRLRNNTEAAPFQALSANNIILNGGMEVSQENGAAQIPMTTGVSRSIVDTLSAMYAHGAATAVFKAQQVTPPGSPAFGLGFLKCVQVTATTALSSPATADFMFFRNAIDAFRIEKLGFGSATNPQFFTVSFWVYATITGTGTLCARNNAANRTYLANFTISSANTWEYKTVTVPVDATGTWTGMDLGICFGTGATFQGTNNAWNAGNFLGTSSTTNFFATANNVVCITGLDFWPGSDAPTSAHSPLAQRPYQEELSLIQRYMLDTKVLNINGGMEVSQELGTTGVTLATGVGKFTADMWYAQYAHAANTAVFTSAQMLAASFPAALPGFPAAQQIKATTALTSPANNDYAQHRTAIEGYRVARLGLGTASAQSFSYGFWFYSTAAGTITVRVTNSAANRLFYVEHAVAAAAWTWCQAVIPGDTTGTWLITNGIGLRFEIFSSGKSASPAPITGAWTATNSLASTNTSNLYATANNTTLITGFVCVPGTNVPDLLRVYGTQRTFDEELMLCQRYLSYDNPAVAGAVFCSGIAYSTTFSINAYRFPVPMRDVPTITSSAAAKWQIQFAGGTVTASAVAFTAPSTRGVRLDLTSATAVIVGSTIAQAIDGTTFLMADARL